MNNIFNFKYNLIFSDEDGIVIHNNNNLDKFLESIDSYYHVDKNITKEELINWVENYSGNRGDNVIFIDNEKSYSNNEFESIKNKREQNNGRI